MIQSGKTETQKSSIDNGHPNIMPMSWQTNFHQTQPTIHHQGIDQFMVAGKTVSFLQK